MANQMVPPPPYNAVYDENNRAPCFYDPVRQRYAEPCFESTRSDLVECDSERSKKEAPVQKMVPQYDAVASLPTDRTTVVEESKPSKPGAEYDEVACTPESKHARFDGPNCDHELKNSSQTWSVPSHYAPHLNVGGVVDGGQMDHGGHVNNVGHVNNGGHGTQGGHFNHEGHVKRGASPMATSCPRLPVVVTHEPKNRGGYLAALDRAMCWLPFCGTKRVGKKERQQTEMGERVGNTGRHQTEMGERGKMDNTVQLRQQDMNDLAYRPPMHEMHQPGMPLAMPLLQQVHPCYPSYPNPYPQQYGGYGNQQQQMQQNTNFQAHIEVNVDTGDVYKCRACGQGKIVKQMNRPGCLFVVVLSVLTCPFISCLPLCALNCMYESKCKKCGMGYGMGTRGSRPKMPKQRENDNNNKF